MIIMNEPFKIIFISYLIIFGFQLYGQSPVQDQVIDHAYLQSISHYESGRYQNAKMGFNQYLKLGKTNSFLVGSHFYLAQIEIEVNQNIQPMIQFTNHYKVEAFYMKALFSLGNYIQKVYLFIFKFIISTNCPFIYNIRQYNITFVSAFDRFLSLKY